MIRKMLVQFIYEFSQLVSLISSASSFFVLLCTGEKVCSISGGDDVDTEIICETIGNEWFAVYLLN